MIISASPEITILHGVSIAKSLRLGDVIALTGDLGAGKTHFVKGLASGLASSHPVTSPTFSLIHEYYDGRLPLYHFDFYRLETALETLQIGLDDYLFGDGVCVIEWAEKFPELLPPSTRWFDFSHRPDDTRQITERLTP